MVNTSPCKNQTQQVTKAKRALKLDPNAFMPTQETSGLHDFNINGAPTIEGAGASRMWATNSNFYDQEKYKANIRISKMIHKKSIPEAPKMVEKKEWNPEMIHRENSMAKINMPSVKGGESLRSISNSQARSACKRRGLYNYGAMEDNNQINSALSEITTPPVIDQKIGTRNSMYLDLDQEAKNDVKVGGKSVFYKGLGAGPAKLGSSGKHKSEFIIKVPTEVDDLGGLGMRGTDGLKIDSGKSVKKESMDKVEQLNFGGEYKAPLKFEAASDDPTSESENLDLKYESQDNLSEGGPADEQLKSSISPKDVSPALRLRSSSRVADIQRKYSVDHTGPFSDLSQTSKNLGK